MIKFLVFSSLVAVCAAAPQTRQVASTCKLDPTFLDGIATPSYYLANWASEGATDGQQCIVADTFTPYSISWHSTFSWEPSRFILGNPNAGYSKFRQGDVLQHSSIPVTWEWEYEGKDVEAAVLVNMLGSGQGCLSTPSWIISIWLGTYGNITPNDGLGNTGTLIDTTTINGIEFDVYRVPNLSRIWYTFQAKDNQHRFDGNLVAFVRWPHENTGNAGAQFRCIWNVQSGTEIWGGRDARFTSKNLTVSQNLSNGPIPHQSR